MSHMGNLVDLAALVGTLGDNEVDVDAFEEKEVGGDEANEFPNRPGLCAAAVVAQGYTVRGVDDRYLQNDFLGVVNRECTPPYPGIKYIEGEGTWERFDEWLVRVLTDASRGWKNLGGAQTGEEAWQWTGRHLSKRFN